jgi:hypothetical protein
VAGPWEPEDVVSIIGGLFDTNAKLERDEDSDEEEAQEDG